MSWQEFEQRALGYGQAVAAEQPKEKGLRDNLKERWQQELAEARAILEKLQARDVLTAIKEEIWHEGEIKEEEQVARPPVGEQILIDLILKSNPYPLIFLTVSRDGKLPEIRLLEHKAQLRISVVRDFDKELTTIGVYAPTIYQLAGEPIKVQQEIKQLDLWGGLRHVLNRGERSWRAEEINPDHPRETDRFFYELVTFINEVKRNESLPYQVRAWSETLLSQFPPDLEKNGVLSYRELQSWGDEIRNSHPIVKAFHQVFP